MQTALCREGDAILHSARLMLAHQGQPRSAAKTRRLTGAPPAAVSFPRATRQSRCPEPPAAAPPPPCCRGSCRDQGRAESVSRPASRSRAHTCSAGAFRRRGGGAQSPLAVELAIDRRVHLREAALYRVARDEGAREHKRGLQPAPVPTPKRRVREACGAVAIKPSHARPSPAPSFTQPPTR
jgi:hypothetical protein